MARDLRPVVACLVVVAPTSIAGVGGSTSVAVAVALGVAVTAAVCVHLDPFAGAVAGLAASAAIILWRRLVGPWGDDEFWLVLAQTAGLVASGVVAGHTGRTLRRRPADELLPGLLPQPIFGSLGLLDADVARDRLEEEVERALAHQRELCVVLVDVHVVEGVSSETSHGARRAVSRIFESRLRPTDIPFALAEGRLGAILPETAAAEAWERIGAILDAVADGRLSTRGGDVEGALGDAVRLEVGMADLRAAVSTADALLDAATASLPRKAAPGSSA